MVVDDDRGSYGDAEDFEVAVSAAASIAARADQDGVDLSLLCGEHAVTGRGLDAVLDVCCRIELGSSDPAHRGPTGAAAGAGDQLAGAAHRGRHRPDYPASCGRLAPDVSLLLVGADRSAPTTVSGTPSARLMSLRALDELPRAIRAAAPTVLT